MRNSNICLLSVFLFFSFSAYNANAQPVYAASAAFPSNATFSLNLPSGYASYIIGCAAGDFTISNTSFAPTVNALTAYIGDRCSSGEVCASIGYQQAGSAYCSLDKADEGVIAGVALNASIANAKIFSAAGANTVTLNYHVNGNSSTTVIVGASGWYGAITSFPANCTQSVNAYSNQSYASVSIAVCNQRAGNYSVALSPPSASNTPIAVAIAAYVFPVHTPLPLQQSATTTISANVYTSIPASMPISTMQESTASANLSSASGPAGGPSTITKAVIAALVAIAMYIAILRMRQMYKKA